MISLFLEITTTFVIFLFFVSLLELPFETDKSKIRKDTISALILFVILIFLLTPK